ncbi:MAG TPA: DJ-1/PfpI family protein [Capsulimonadaceae bacterium]|jgi:transcriptional regulator GlxA family with amidase domain
MHSVAIVCYEGVDEVELFGPFDVLSSVRTMEKGHWSNDPAFDVKIVAETVGRTVTSHGVALYPQAAYPNASQYDIIIVPGGPGARLIKYPESLKGWLTKQCAGAKVVVSLSTGAFILARSGVLAKRRVAIYPAFAADIRRIEPTANVVTGERVIMDRNSLISTSGISNSIDAVIALIEKIEGIRSAEIASKRISWPVHIDDIAPLYSS